MLIVQGGTPATGQCMVDVARNHTYGCRCFRRATVAVVRESRDRTYGPHEVCEQHARCYEDLGCGWKRVPMTEVRS